MLTFHVAENRLKEVLTFLKTEATPKFLRLDDFTAIDESARRGLQPYVAYAGTVANEISGGETDTPCRARLTRTTPWSITCSLLTLLPVCV